MDATLHVCVQRQYTYTVSACTVHGSPNNYKYMYMYTCKSTYIYEHLLFVQSCDNDPVLEHPLLDSSQNHKK